MNKLKVPVKWAAERIIRAVMRFRGWKFPEYFVLRDKWQALTGGVERDLQLLASRTMIPGETVLDIGANAGLISRHFAHCVGPGGRVLAFEPEPGNVDALKFNLRRLPWACVYEMALSDTNEVATFYLNCVSGTGNSLVPHALGTREIKVRCQTLDEFLAKNQDVRPDWIKIDVEGAEPRVLRGMQKTVRNFPEVRLLIELCPANLGGMEQAAQLVMEIKKMDFQVFLINMDGSTSPFLGVTSHSDSLARHGYFNIYCARARGV